MPPETPTAALQPAPPRDHHKGLRMVALLEFTKGAVVVLAGLGLLSMRHRDIWGIAESLLELLRINPHHHSVAVFIALTHRASDWKLWKVATIAAVYATGRFIESYGLWKERTWAEWFAIISGSAYLPFEVYELARRVTWPRVLILVINLVIVAYMVYLRLVARRERRAPHAGV